MNETQKVSIFISPEMARKMKSSAARRGISLSKYLTACHRRADQISEAEHTMSNVLIFTPKPNSAHVRELQARLEDLLAEFANRMSIAEAIGTLWVVSKNLSEQDG